MTGIPEERLERYITALRSADKYALIHEREDFVRFAEAVIAVANDETDPVYKSGYDTGVMHAGAGQIAAERDCLAMAVLFARQWEQSTPVGLREGIDEILATMPTDAEKSGSPAAGTTPQGGAA